MMSLFHRAFRRAGMSLAYSDGFHPQPRISLRDALPVGMESEEEVVDFELISPMKCDILKGRINLELPEGLEVFDVSPSFGKRKKDTMYSEYKVIFHPAPGFCLEIEFHKTLVDDFLSRNEIYTSGDGKSGKPAVNIRLAIEDLSLIEDGNRVFGIRMCLKQINGRIVRPHTVLSALYGGITHENMPFKVIKLSSEVRISK